MSGLTPRLRRGVERAGGLVVLALVLPLTLFVVVLGPATPAGAAARTPGTAPSSGAARSPVAVGPDRVTLLGQSATVGDGGVFHLRLGITASDPSNEYLTVQAFHSLTTRTAFDQAMGGDMGCGAASCRPIWSTGALALGGHTPGLTPDPSGGFDVEIPVTDTQSTDENGIQTFWHPSYLGDAVFPIQVGIYKPGGVPQGGLLTTFMVYALKSDPFPALSVALVLPVHAAPAVGADGRRSNLPSSDTSRLSALAETLGGAPSVPVTLDVTPETAEGLASGSPADQGILTRLLADVDAARDQVLPDTYVSVSLPGMEQAGMDAGVTNQIQLGRTVDSAVLGTAPSPSTWAVNGPLGSAGFGALSRAGATQLIVPDGDLSPLPGQYSTTTFAQPAQLVDGRGVASVYASDPGLTRDFTARGGSVLAANRLLAEMAMIQMETPSRTRGVAVMPPPGWGGEGVFLRTVLAGLSSDPLLNPVTVNGLFRSVPRASLVRTFEPVASVPDLSALASSLRSAEKSVVAFGSVLSTVASARQEAARVARTLVVAESSDLSPAQSRAVIAAAVAAVSGVFRQITLPGSSSITLTSTRGQLPLTVLSGTPLHTRIELRVSASRLIFQSFTTPYGRCVASAYQGAVCDLTLTDRNTTLKMPVEARSSGVFPLDVAVWSPDGSKLIAYERDTVRSTAVSDVGLILIIVAVLSLGIWWARDLRHGRRARQLMPVPTDVERPGPGVDVDPFVDEFFEHPPPTYDPLDPRGPVDSPGVLDDRELGRSRYDGPEYARPEYATTDYRDEGSGDAGSFDEEGSYGERGSYRHPDLRPRGDEGASHRGHRA